MKKIYEFWLNDQDEVLSSNSYYNSKDAGEWAINLLWYNPSAKWCKFKSVNGRKEYSVDRIQCPHSFLDVL
jgi:hypothetical protein